MVEDTSKWWWIGNHNTYDLSPWLRSTLSEMDAKTKAMLRVIEEEADSFAERAEMYYKKRPELIAMVEDLYRTYRSLAERYDLARSSSLHKHAPPETPHRSTYNEEESWMIQAPETPEKSVHVLGIREKSTCDEEETWMIEAPETPKKSVHVLGIREKSTCDEEETWMIEAPETPKKSVHFLGIREKSTCGEEESWMIEAPETPKKSTYKEEPCRDESETEEYAESEVDDGESSVDDAEAMAKMKEEIERLREENRVSKELLREKDEEKREAIRQLSVAVEMLREENSEIKKRVSAAANKQRQASPKKQLWSSFGFKNLKEGFLGRSWQLGSTA